MEGTEESKDLSYETINPQDQPHIQKKKRIRKANYMKMAEKEQ